MATIGVRAPHRLGEIRIKVTYSFWSDNTWYCASKGVMGATSGTWEINRGFGGDGAGAVSFYDGGGDLIAAGDGFAFPDMTGYPFNEDFKNRASTFRFFKQDSAWYLGRYMALGADELLECSWWMVTI